MSRMESMVVNEQPTALERGIYYMIGFVLVLYAALLCGASWTPYCTFSEWCNNFVQFIIVEHHFIVGFTSMTPKLIALFEVIWTLGYLWHITKIQHPFRGREHGDDRWGNPKEFTKKYGNHDPQYLVEVNFGKDVKPPKKPVYVNTNNYWLAEGVFLDIDNDLTSNLNIEIVGPPGTGKSFRAARPILSQLAGNFLVTDPKGELSQQTGQYMEDNGYGVFVLNCQSEKGMRLGCRFNPFPYIETESDILGLCEILFKATTNPDATSDDQFFENMAQVLLSCIFYLMHYTYPRQNQDWKHFVELLDSSAVKADPQTGGIDLSDPNCLMNRYARANEKWKMEHNGENLKGYTDIEKIYTGAQETSSSIVASLDAHCKYMKLDCVIELLSEDDLDFINTFGYCKPSSISKTGKYILYIVTSENERYYDWIPSMVYSLFISKLYNLTATDESLNQTLPVHLTFLMDEFANTTLPGDIVGLSSTMRSRGLSLMPIVQNFQQYKDKFPKNDKDKNFRSNMAVCIVLGGPDMESCKTLSEEFGKETIHKQTTGLTRGTQGSSSENEDVMEHALLPPEKIFKMKKNGPCAIRIKGTEPLWVQKTQFQKSPLCPLLTRKKHYKYKRKKKFVENVKYDFSKSPCDQIPEFCIGTAADEAVEQCEKEGIKVVKLTLEDIDAYTVLERHKKELLAKGKNATTKEFWEQIHKNSEQVLKEKVANTLDFDNYDDMQVIVVQKLRNKGFAPIQIHALEPLIKINTEFDEIVTFFSPTMDLSEIEEFSLRLSKIKSKL